MNNLLHLGSVSTETKSGLPGSTNDGAAGSFLYECFINDVDQGYQVFSRSFLSDAPTCVPQE